MSIKTSLHRCVTENAPNIDDFTYDWVVTGASIIAGQNEAVVQVLTDSEATSHFTLECTVTSTTVDPDNADAIGSATYSIEASHERTSFATEIKIVLNGSCSYAEPATSCESTGTYKVVSENDLSDAYYEWIIISGNVTIVGSPNFSTVTVITDDPDDFTLDCVTTLNSVQSISTITTSHERYKVPDPIEIVSIDELTSTGCFFNTGGTCEAFSTHSLTTDKTAISYNWSVTDATIIGSTTSDTVQVTTDSNELVDTFALTCSVVDEFGGTDEKTVSFSHSRAESVNPVVVVQGPNSLTGSYIYPDIEGSIFATYTATTDEINDPTFVWSIESGNAIISGSNTSPTANAVVTDSQSGSFIIKVVASNEFVSVQNALSVSYTMTNNTTAPVITGISTDGTGCSIEEDQTTCVAISTHTVSVQSNTGAGSLTYNWNVTGALLSGGQGTDTITAETDSDEKQITFTVSCTVTDELNESDTDAILASHNRISGGSLDYTYLADGCWWVVDDEMGYGTGMHSTVTSDNREFLFSFGSLDNYPLDKYVPVYEWDDTLGVYVKHSQIHAKGYIDNGNRWEVGDVSAFNDRLVVPSAERTDSTSLSVPPADRTYNGTVDLYEWDGSEWVFYSNMFTDSEFYSSEVYSVYGGYADTVLCDNKTDEFTTYQSASDDVWYLNGLDLFPASNRYTFSVVNDEMIDNIRLYDRNAPGTGWAITQNIQYNERMALSSNGLMLIQGNSYTVRATTSETFDFNTRERIGSLYDSTIESAIFRPGRDDQIALIAETGDSKVELWQNFGTQQSPQWQQLKRYDKTAALKDHGVFDARYCTATNRHLLITSTINTNKFNGFLQIDWED